MTDDTPTPKPSGGGVSAKRKSTVHPIEVQSILNGSAMAAKPSPVEHVASPASPTYSFASSLRGHNRAWSIAESTSSGATVRSNRFSTSFPVQPAGSSSPTRLLARSPTREGPAVVPENLASPTGPTDTNFLTAIAASERKVLELREELQRAEADLNALKKRWTQHEANKKRNDARRVTKLEPLKTSSPTGNGGPGAKEEDASVAMQAEAERRKALMNGGRSSNRTVFSGSRHTRTLSLLSPATDVRAKKELPTRKHTSPRTAKRSTDSDRPATRPALIARASTTSDLTNVIVNSTDPGMSLPDNLDKAQLDPLIQHGKRLATDFSTGLWTFFEDLRQATVGEEAMQGSTHYPTVPPSKANSPEARRQRALQARASRTTLRPATAERSRAVAAATPSPARSRHVKSATQGALPDLADPSFFTSEQGVNAATPAKDTVKKSPGGHRKTSSKAVSVSSTDAPWDTWDDDPIVSSPKALRSDSSGASSTGTTLPSTISNSPRPSVEMTKDPQKDLTATDQFIKDPSAQEVTKADARKTQTQPPIPWPALSKFGPATLRRTASHLMNEWERSLTPSPGKEFKGHGGDYLGISAEAAAIGAKGKVG
ncbi:hypothetical protein LTR53_014469 [Teratosphaeriaceae sp. CCFEE 6253]|nr:hypothetical protein LTR53_014469 [Teratosphaeriaceae sp. CCFEE 6253]